MTDQENLEMDDILERITFYCLDEAQTKLEAGDELTPFTVIVDGDQMFEENFPGDDVVSCRHAASQTSSPRARSPRTTPSATTAS